jgi:hypothetical protein
MCTAIVGFWIFRRPYQAYIVDRGKERLYVSSGCRPLAGSLLLRTVNVEPVTEKYQKIQTFIVQDNSNEL